MRLTAEVWILYKFGFRNKSKLLDLWRKTRSMHLYQGGMPLEAIALFLGHEDPVVTRVYARADTEMKRRVIEEAQSKGVGVEYLEASKSAIWIGNEEIIKKLCGLG